MSVQILYTDLRDEKTIMEIFTVEWEPLLTAETIIRKGLNKEMTEEVITHLLQNSKDIFIAWVDENLKNHSGIGGITALDWEVPDGSEFIITFTNNKTTKQQKYLAYIWEVKNTSIKSDDE